MSNLPYMSAMERPRGAARRRALMLAVAIGIPGISACMGMAPAMAHAHHRHATPQAPMYITSDPQAGSSVQSAPSNVSVTFSQPLDSSSKLRVIDNCGARVDTGGAQITVNQISVPLRKQPSGKYIVLYTAVGPQGLTGATTNGFTFTVTSGMPCGMKMNMGGMGGMGHGGHNGGGDHMGMGSMHGSKPGHSMDMTMTNHAMSGGSMQMNNMTMSSGSSHSHHSMTGMHGMGGMKMGGKKNQPPPSASGALSAFDLRPDGTMALVALGLAGALGGLGGLVLRLSA
ncbi:MAG: CopC domain [Actinomycetota bacterium]|nr:CopC domain [Actinomycetota bacterium]